MDSFARDLQHGARQLIRKPGFSAAAIASLALGIGLNTTLFSVVNAVLLRDRLVSEPDRLVEIYTGLNAGLPAAHHVVPGLSRHSARRDRVERDRRQRVRPRHPVERRASRSGHGRGGLVRLLRCAGNPAGHRSRLSRGRERGGRRCPGRRAQSRALAAPVRWPRRMWSAKRSSSRASTTPSSASPRRASPARCPAFSPSSGRR